MPLPEHRYQYQQIAETLRGQIVTGEVPPGSRLSSERRLCVQFHVQRNTVRKALELLEAEGRLFSTGRKGYFVQPVASAAATHFLVNVRRVGALYEGFHKQANELGYSVGSAPRGSSNDLPDPEQLPPNTAGMLLWPTFPTDPETLRRLQLVTPVVLIDRRIPGVSTDFVHFDDLAGGRMVTEHLLELGHRKIAFLTDEILADTVQLRWHGYVAALDAAAVEYIPRLSLLYQRLDPDILAASFRILLESPDRPTAVVCSNDLIAMGLLRFLHGQQIRVPEEIAVTGYGNDVPEYAAAMTLTTVHQPFFEAGIRAASLLQQRSRQSLHERMTRFQDVALPVQLVPRGSTHLQPPR